MTFWSQLYWHSLAAPEVSGYFELKHFERLFCRVLFPAAVFFIFRSGSVLVLKTPIFLVIYFPIFLLYYCCSCFHFLVFGLFGGSVSSVSIISVSGAAPSDVPNDRARYRDEVHTTVCGSRVYFDAYSFQLVCYSDGKHVFYKELSKQERLTPVDARKRR